MVYMQVFQFCVVIYQPLLVCVFKSLLFTCNLVPSNTSENKYLMNNSQLTIINAVIVAHLFQVEDHSTSSCVFHPAISGIKMPKCCSSSQRFDWYS